MLFGLRLCYRYARSLRGRCRTGLRLHTWLLVRGAPETDEQADLPVLELVIYCAYLCPQISVARDEAIPHMGVNLQMHSLRYFC